jgi:transcription-repair coupling factor (superfamily II helicase)
VRITLGALSAGSEYPQRKLAVLTEGQLTESARGKSARSVPPRPTTNRQKLQSYTDLTPGDLVVHVHHGIGRFVGMIRMPVDGVEKDYIKIAYAGSDCLYVPATQLDLVSKYIGSGTRRAERTRLNKLGGTEWAKATYKARRRPRIWPRGSFSSMPSASGSRALPSPPTLPGSRSLRTPLSTRRRRDDQLRAIREIKGGHGAPRPMDRLLCGDVGYGKTEVALRAVMKCVLDGKQAAILVPTTVLAQQHYSHGHEPVPQSFPVTHRGALPLPHAQGGESHSGSWTAGSMDLVIGTHKLLQKNVTSRIWACWSSTRSSASASPTRKNCGRWPNRWTR